MGGVIGILYNEPAHSGTPFSEASRDVLTQVEAIQEALGGLGLPSVSIPFSRDPCAPIQAIRRHGISMLFNLCESVDEVAALAGHPAAVLELMGLPFSGSPSLALMLTTDKWYTKRILREAGISTPGSVMHDGKRPLEISGIRYPVILKPRFEDASIGIDQDSVCDNEEVLRARLPAFADRFGDILIEEYVEGREFNISLLGDPEVSVLPPAEIDFSAFPEDLYPIVGYRAKWDEDSFEYGHTNRIFPQDLNPSLHKGLEQVAVRCFELFMLRDYGRVDLRLDSKGEAHVLEINANPCLSPDAGFAAAADRAGLTYQGLVERLVSYMARRNEESHDTSAHIRR